LIYVRFCCSKKSSMNCTRYSAIPTGQWRSKTHYKWNTWKGASWRRYACTLQSQLSRGKSKRKLNLVSLYTQAHDNGVSAIMSAFYLTMLLLIVTALQSIFYYNIINYNNNIMFYDQRPNNRSSVLLHSKHLRLIFII